MTVRIVAYTKWADKPHDAGDEDIVSYCARVSNPANQENYRTSGKLLKYLYNHRHWSPFEMVNVVMELECTRDIGRQILRHRSFSFQEFSQRYSEHMGFDRREARLQDPKNRQNSVRLDMHDEKDLDIYDHFMNIQDEVVELASKKYREAIDLGIAKEQARSILPEGLTRSRMYMNGTLRSWIHFCAVRMDPSSQQEISDIAYAAWIALKEIYPFLQELEM